MINDTIQRLIIYVALGGAVFASGFGFGVNYANKDNNRKLQDAMAKRESQTVAVDKIVTEYVDRIVTKEVIKYVPNPDDCSHASGDFRVWFDRSARGLSEATGDTDAATVPFADLAATIGATHSVCHDTARQLEALQAWAAEVSK